MGKKPKFDIHEILKPPNSPEDQERRPKQQHKQFPKLGKLTENTTLGEKSHRITTILVSQADISLPLEKEKKKQDLFDAVFNMADSDGSSDEESNEIKNTQPLLIE